jgi:hypothetical protein
VRRHRPRLVLGQRRPPQRQAVTIADSAHDDDEAIPTTPQLVALPAEPAKEAACTTPACLVSISRRPLDYLKGADTRVLPQKESVPKLGTLLASISDLWIFSGSKWTTRLGALAEEWIWAKAGGDLAAPLLWPMLSPSPRPPRLL